MFFGQRIHHKLQLLQILQLYREFLVTVLVSKDYTLNENSKALYQIHEPKKKI